VTRTPTIVLGGTGYVAGEVLRLVICHPRLELAGVMSDSQPGEALAKAFPHLAPVLRDLRFLSETEIEGLITSLPKSAVFAAAPHGVSASLIDKLLRAAEAAGTHPHIVDISADYRYRSAETYTAVYKHTHGAPSRLKDFTCALPEHLSTPPTPHIAHPGCFATATLLASVPLLSLGLASPTLFVNGVTGSTGSGREPVDGTHHPTRHSDIYAYNPLAHRHASEITACAAAASGITANFAFVPHSGPFARGIHVTVQGSVARTQDGLDSETLLAKLRKFYEGSIFIRIVGSPPRLKDVVASNYAHLHATTDGRTLAVMCVIDNLTKGAAGGAVQWMNRLLALPESTGLTAPAAGWT